MIHTIGISQFQAIRFTTAYCHCRTDQELSSTLSLHNPNTISAQCMQIPNPSLSCSLPIILWCARMIIFLRGMRDLFSAGLVMRLMILARKDGDIFATRTLSQLALAMRLMVPRAIAGPTTSHLKILEYVIH